MRRISWPLYLTALVVSIIIFFSGFYFASLIEQSVKLDMKSKLDKFNEGSTLLQIMTLTQEDSSYCPIYKEAMLNSYDEIDRIGRDLSYLEESKGQKNVELKKSYFMFELKTYLLATKIKELCGEKNNLTLFVYSSSCDKCNAIGNKLTELRKRNGSIKVFSFEDGLNSSVVDSIKEKYFIKDVPAVVMDGKRITGNNIVEKLDAMFGGGS